MTQSWLEAGWSPEKDEEEEEEELVEGAGEGGRSWGCCSDTVKLAIFAQEPLGERGF